MDNTQALIHIKQTFVDAIKAQPWIETIYPSSTNFVLIRTKQDVNLFDYLKKHGVVTRNQSHESALHNCVRITIGTQASMLEVADLICQYPQTSL